MGASNRHGGLKLSRKLKVLFANHPARHSIFRQYYTKKLSLGDAASTAQAPAPAVATQAK